MNRHVNPIKYKPLFTQKPLEGKPSPGSAAMIEFMGKMMTDDVMIITEDNIVQKRIETSEQVLGM